MSHKKQKTPNEVTEALVLVAQIGITMLVPMVLCCIGGAWLDGKFGIKWMGVVGFFLGAIAGFQNVYRLIKKYLQDEKSPGEKRREQEEKDVQRDPKAQ